MIISADLHIHGRYSMATSKKMIPTVIASQAKLKGLDLVGTGDAFHSKWLEIIKDTVEETEKGIYSVNIGNKEEKFEYGASSSESGSRFILTAEVEDIKRVHHLLIIPHLEAAYGIREKLRGNLDSDGRPKVRMKGEEIMDLAHDFECIMGPSHAFTPWTSIYKEYDSIYDCYGRKPDFLELGLSADTDMADRIEELQDIPFLTNSDAHSPWPHRLGREFNEIDVKDISYKSITDAIGEKNITANYGFNPRLGKYHKTACTRCFKIYDIEEAKKLKMRCPCGGTIKKGVDYRISELAKWKEPHNPEHRPPYIHILPLAEIISLGYDKGITTVFVQNIWKELVQKFGSEIAALIYAPLEELKNIDEKLGTLIKSFRDNTLKIQSGGGGRYGKIILEDPPNEEDEKPVNRTLDAYF
jgi:uncharacterized protein (TIGR00375 family)